MAQSIESIQEINEVDNRKASRAAWSAYHQYCNPIETSNGDAVHKRDLTPQAIDCLDRTQMSAESAMAQVQLASNNDQIRENTSISKIRPQGSNVVQSAAESAGLIKPRIQSLFDLTGSMGKRKDRQILASQNFPATAPALSLASTSSPSETKPVLQLPKTAITEHTKNYLRLVLDMHGSMEKIIGDSTDHFDKQTRKDLRDLEALREAKIKAIEDYSKELSTKESWATLQTVARYLAYASSLAIGAMLLNTGVGGPAGYLLIAAGGLGLVSSVASDAGLWQAMAAHMNKSQETQKHIVQSIELATTLLPLGLGLMGTLLASPTQAPTAFAWMSAALSSSAKLGEGWSEKKRCYVQAEIQLLDKQIRSIEQDTKASTNHLLDDIMKAKLITEEMERILSNSEINLS